jgi:hypothetical protein
MQHGAAFCKMLSDSDGRHDFEYNSVNAAFGLLTGLNNVVGRKVSEVIPGIHESNPDFFTIYQRVALTGRPVRETCRNSFNFRDVSARANFSGLARRKT